MKQWQYNPELGDQAISEVETDNVVLYVDDVNPEVITQVVEMHNEEYSLKRIFEHLNNDERVTPDEVEFLMEELEKYEELEKKAGTEKEAPFPLNLEEQSTEPKIEKNMAIYGDVAHTNDETIAATQLQQEGQTVVSKRGKRGTGNTTGKKKMSLEDMIQEMESKIELAKVFQNIPEIPFPENMSKSARDLMLRFQKEYKELVEKYIVEIQEM